MFQLLEFLLLEDDRVYNAAIPYRSVWTATKRARYRWEIEERQRWTTISRLLAARFSTVLARPAESAMWRSKTARSQPSAKPRARPPRPSRPRAGSSRPASSIFI